MARTKGRITNLVSAKTKSDSLRTTVPSFVVTTLHLNATDQLEWDFDPMNRETLVVKVIRGHTEERKEE